MKCARNLFREPGLSRLAEADVAMNPRFQAIVLGTFFALLIGWVLYIGKGVFVPIVFSVLVVYVIVGLARIAADHC